MREVTLNERLSAEISAGYRRWYFNRCSFGNLDFGNQ